MASIRAARDLDSPVRDQLTGLVNRVGLEVLVEYAMARTKRDGESFSLCAIDVERFDDVAPEESTQLRDAAVAELADLFTSELRGCDVVARSGDSQIALILAWTDDRQAGIVVDHLTAAVRIRNAVSQSPFKLRAVVRRASFGFGSEGEDPKDFTKAVLDGLRGGRGVPLA